MYIFTLTKHYLYIQGLAHDLQLSSWFATVSHYKHKQFLTAKSDCRQMQQ